MFAGFVTSASAIKNSITGAEDPLASKFVRKSSNFGNIEESLMDARQNLQRAALNPKTSADDLRERIKEYNAFCKTVGIPKAQRIQKIDMLMKLHFGIVTGEEQAQYMLGRAACEVLAMPGLFSNTLSIFSKPDICDAVAEIISNPKMFCNTAENPPAFLQLFNQYREALQMLSPEVYKKKLKDLRGHISPDCQKKLADRVIQIEQIAKTLISDKKEELIPAPLKKLNSAIWNLCKEFCDHNSAFEKALKEYEENSDPEHEQSRDLIQKALALKNIYCTLIEDPLFEGRKTNRATNRYDDEFFNKIAAVIQKAEYNLATRDLLAQLRAEEAEYERVRASCNENQNPDLKLCIKVYAQGDCVQEIFLKLTKILHFRPDGETAEDILFLRKITKTQSRIELHLKDRIEGMRTELTALTEEKPEEIYAKKEKITALLSQIKEDMELLAAFITSCENQELADHLSNVSSLLAQVALHVDESCTPTITRIKDYILSYIPTGS